jgi:hypothetical protein
MKLRMSFFCLAVLTMTAQLKAQEANSGFDLGATMSGEAVNSHQLTNAPRDGGSTTAAFRAILYPTWKLNRHWALTGALEAYSRPYFFEDFNKQGNRPQGQILQAELSYSRFWGDRSLVVRLGQLPSAFGSFLLRYDDGMNPLVDVPMSYGYYLHGVTTESLAGAEVDTTLGRVDMRAQFTNSSPANPRSILDHDQYGNWTAGAGYTIRQGLRVGASAYRGPYLDRSYPYYFAGELAPSRLPATGFGVDLGWGRGRWNVNAEWQRFQMNYTVMPNFVEHTGYGEVRVVLHPRFYLATRLGYLRANAFPGHQSYEAAIGFRPGTHELIKLEYEVEQGPRIRGTQQNTLAIQFTTTVNPLSIAGH